MVKSDVIEGVGVDNVNARKREKERRNEWLISMSRDASRDHEN